MSRQSQGARHNGTHGLGRNRFGELKFINQNRSFPARTRDEDGNSVIKIGVEVASESTFLNAGNFSAEVRYGVDPGNEAVGHFIHVARKLFSDNLMDHRLLDVAERVSGYFFLFKMRS